MLLLVHHSNFDEVILQIIVHGENGGMKMPEKRYIVDLNQKAICGRRDRMGAERASTSWWLP